MQKRAIVENVFWMGALDWNRRLFDALIPLPDGTTYNAYLVRGSDKTALLDATDPSRADWLMAQLDDVPRLDYLVAHHAEQDHSGTIPQVLAKYPEARLIVSQKGKELLAAHLMVPEDRMDVVEDGATLSLGDLTLEFLYTPWVHWPETMCTYLREKEILFSCDLFGSHYTTTDLFAREREVVMEAAKRYYAEIMMPFRMVIRKNLEKVCVRPLKIIAPSHGPLYDQPGFILDAYKDWTSSAVKNEVVLMYVSMHGSTEAMARHLTAALAERQVRVRLFDLAVTDMGKLAMALVDAATLAVGMPTVLGGPHPAVAYAATLANALRPKLRFAAIFGSYGWTSQAVERLKELMPNLKLEFLEPVLCQGYPRPEQFSALDKLATTMAERHTRL